MRASSGELGGRIGLTVLLMPRQWGYSCTLCSSQTPSGSHTCCPVPREDKRGPVGPEGGFFLTGIVSSSQGGNQETAAAKATPSSIWFHFLNPRVRELDQMVSKGPPFMACWRTRQHSPCVFLQLSRRSGAGRRQCFSQGLGRQVNALTLQTLVLGKIFSENPRWHL